MHRASGSADDWVLPLLLKSQPVLRTGQGNMVGLMPETGERRRGNQRRWHSIQSELGCGPPVSVLTTRNGRAKAFHIPY